MTRWTQPLASALNTLPTGTGGIRSPSEGRVQRGSADVMRDGRQFISLRLLLVAPMCDSLIRSSVRLIVPPLRSIGPAAQEAFDAAWRA